MDKKKSNYYYGVAPHEVNPDIYSYEANKAFNSTFGLKYIAEQNNCKSGYMFSIKTIDDKFIGILGIDYTKKKTKLSKEQINKLEILSSGIGGVLINEL